MGLSMQMAIKKNKLFIRLSGELDSSSALSLKEKVSLVVNKYMVKHLILNLERLEFMDSSGIGFVIGRYNELKKRNGKIIICSMNKTIEKIIRLSGLKKICLISQNEMEAEKLLEVA